MCFVAAGASAAAIANATLAIGAISTAATVGMGVYSAYQQSAQAQAQMNAQAAAQQQAIAMQQQQMGLQQSQMYQQQLLNQNQIQQQLEVQQRQQYQQLELQQRQNADAQNLQVQQSNAQLVNQYNQARQQVINERATLMAKNAADRLTYQRSVETTGKQILNNNEAANRVYVAEQQKIIEAKKRAAFEQQAILSKSIGNMGNVLAAGRTGASIGLLLNDVERQRGFAMAQQQATLDSQRDASIIAMEGGWLQNINANNQALSNIAWNPSDPYLPQFPELPTFVNGIGLQIDAPRSKSNGTNL